MLGRPLAIQPRHTHEVQTMSVLRRERAVFGCSAALLLLSTVVMPLSVAAARQPPPVGPDDYGRWESPGTATLSPDGAWIAYGIRRVNGENELRIRAIAGDSVISIPYGSRPSFSKGSRWLAYGIGISQAEQEKLRKAKKPVRNSLGVIDLASGERIRIGAVAAFDFSPDGRWLAMRRYPAEKQKSGGVDLIVRDLERGTDINFGNVSAHAWQPEGSLLAMTIESADGTGNGFIVYDPGEGTLRSLDSSDRRYAGIAWREEGDDVAVLRTVEREAYEGPGHVILAWRDLRSRRSRSVVFDPATRKDFPGDTRIVDYRRPAWAEDGSAIFFGIQEWLRKPEEAPISGEEGGEGEERGKGGEGKPSEVQIWHARDVRIIPMQRSRAERDRRRNYLSVWHLASDRFVQLADREVENVSVARGSRYALGTDARPYEREAMFGRRYLDLYRIEVASGAREKIAGRIRYQYGTSPEGRYVLYVKDDNYWTYDLERKRHVNISSDAPTSWVNTEYDYPVAQFPPFGIAGWAEGDGSVLLYDRYDIWRARPDGSTIERLTDGVADSVRHRYVRLDAEEESIDPGRPLYLSLYGEWTKKYGYARLRLGRGVERLVWMEKNVGRLVRAGAADVYAYLVQDFDDSPDYFVGDGDLSGARRVTDTNPFQVEYTWGRSELVEYRSARGRRLQGALFYPAGYEPGRRYPMIVYVYERRSQVVHNYTSPSERSPYNTTVFTSEGYFVLQPDIVFRPRDPGLSAVECVVPAVDKVIGSGMVDPDRIGLVGHSWGGYEATFIPTQTDRFAAAVAGAPITNLFSFMGAIHWSSGMPETEHWETGQVRMDVPYWEDRDAYIRNSPAMFVADLETPMLMAFGDDDGTVDFGQGVEFYNYARRARKNFVMLVYPDEGHSLRQKQNQIDYHHRILQWFGHYLKGEEAPKWMTEGVSYLEREREIKRGGGGS